VKIILPFSHSHSSTILEKEFHLAKTVYRILYRGPLSGCNYRCPYCPFAARRDTAGELATDRQALRRFCDWLAGRSETFAVFFTPRGEALIHPWYRETMVELSRLPHIHKVAIQTNLSCSLDWVREGDPGKLAFWCSYHLSQVERTAFLQQCRLLRALGVSFSVGMVGMREHFDEIALMRDALPADVYLWINAYKRDPGYYSEDEITRLAAIDPLFRYNLPYYPSRGHACRCGSTTFFVDGEEIIHRCPFVPEPLGRLDSFPAILQASPCPANTCHCHIGYAHMPELGLEAIFGDGILERVPQKSDAPGDC